MAWSWVGAGTRVGAAWVHVTPSQVQVSASWPELPLPPCSTTTPRAASRAMACRWRAGGEAAGPSWVQEAPFQAQVSPW